MHGFSLDPDVDDSPVKPPKPKPSAAAAAAADDGGDRECDIAARQLKDGDGHPHHRGAQPAAAAAAAAMEATGAC